MVGTENHTKSSQMPFWGENEFYGKKRQQTQEVFLVNKLVADRK